MAERNFWSVVVLSILVCLMNFDLGNNPNALSRLLPVLSLTEEGHLHFDRFKDLTMDKGQIGEHFYSDKAPFTTFAVLPFYATAAKIFSWRSETAPHPAVFVFGNILCGWLPFFLWLLLLKKESRVFFQPVALVMGFALTSFPVAYLGSVFGHLWAGLFLVMAWRSAGHIQAARTGLWLGLAFLTEYPMIVFAPFLALRLLRPQENLRAQWPVVFKFAAALFFAGLLCLSYNFILSGNALKMPYAFVNDPAFAHAQTHYGFRLPSLKAIWGMLLGFKRGAFFYAPVLFYLAWVFFRRTDLRRFVAWPWSEGTQLAAAGAGFVFFMSSYAMWWGGWSYGPRHLIPLYLLLGWVILPRLDGASLHPRAWAFWSGLGAVSLLLALFTVGFMIPDHFLYPWWEPMLKHLLAGRLNPQNFLLTWLL